MTHVAPLLAALALLTPAANAPVNTPARVVPLVTTSPTHPKLNDDERQTLSAVTLAMSSLWMGAVIDAANRVPVRGMYADLWPDADDDLDVDAAVALQRRWYLAAPPVAEIAEAHPALAAVCFGAEPGDGTATVFAIGSKSIAAIDTALAILPLAQGRALPVAMPVVTVHPAADIDEGVTALTKGRPCIALKHDKGDVRFPPTFKMTLPKRSHRQRLRFACPDRASIVAAAERFVDVFAHDTRDAVHALPTPLIPPVLAGFANERVTSALVDMRILGWRLEANAADVGPRRSDDAVLLLELNDDKSPAQAQVRLRAGRTRATVELEIEDDTCRLNAVPFPWSPYKAPNGDKVFTDELSGWRHVGEAWVKGPAPDLVNTQPEPPPSTP
jgi:hypothetical protein